MIGSLLCYVLSPITRAARHVSDRGEKHDAQKMQLCSVMTSKRVQEGGITPPQMEQQQTGLDQEQNTGGGVEQRGEWERRPFTGVGHGQALNDGEEKTNAEEKVPQTERRHVHQVVSAEVLKNGCPQKGGADGVEGESAEGDMTHKVVGEGEAVGALYLAESECGEARSGVLRLAAVLTDAGDQVLVDCVQPMPAGWHFPTGPGLSQVTFCPAQQFPLLSYYPEPQQRAPFEVVWRLWENLVHPREVAAEPHAPFEFTIMSYNVLAQDLVDTNPELYHYCAPDVLAWDVRFQNILLELQKWKPDIVCLQEVQKDHYVKDFLPALTEQGYNSVYKQRTGVKTDGCAVCYRRSRFSQVQVRLVEYFRPELQVLDRHNVAVVVLLQPVSEQGSEIEMQTPPICVANTHLVFNPRRGDVKLAQLAVLLAEIDYMVKPWRLTRAPCPIVLCGDFNALPNTPLYQLITLGQLYYHGLPAWMISGQENLSHRMYYRTLGAPLWPETLGISDNCQYTGGVSSRGEVKDTQIGRIRYSHDFLLQLRFCKPARVRPKDLVWLSGVTDIVTDPLTEQPTVPRFRTSIQHGLNLRSVYSHYVRGTCQPEVTSLHSDIAATVDYIFYSPALDRHSTNRGHRPQQDGCLKLIGRLALLSEETLWQINGLPNKSFPSDHLCLLAKFQLSSRRT